MLQEKFQGIIGKAISCTLILTTTLLPLRLSYAQQDFDQAVADANAFAGQLRSGRANPDYDANGNLLVDGKVYMSKEDITGQRKNDYLPAQSNTYGSDAQTLQQGQIAHSKYEEKTLETAETSAERAYHMVKQSISKQKPDLTNDPMWNNTDNVLSNLEDIAKDFANCKVETKLVSSGKEYHVPKYEQCERLPAIEESFSIGHEYKVGVIKHKSGPANILPCGDGCLKVWIGDTRDNIWKGNCTIYEQKMSLEVIQPNKIISAKLDRSVYDDYHQVYLNGDKIWQGPNGNFPPETPGKCELKTSWDQATNVNVTDAFSMVSPGSELVFKTRTSVSGEGEGYSSLRVNYDPTDLIHDEVWYDEDLINKAYKVKEQIDDGYCTGSFRCADMPTLDASGCTVINGIKVCESNFSKNPIAGLGLSPFCKKVEVSSDCGFNEGQICFTDMDGKETCFNNDTVDRDQCKAYENDPTCSFVKTECVQGAEGPSGNCYVQEDTYDCGFTATTGTPVEEEVITCDGQLQCVGEECYSSVRDGANTEFGKVNAYLEMLKYARSDMMCEGIPDAPYNDTSPPDRYTPISGCPEGFTYNKETNQCLQQTGCTYSENDFYAASVRNGVQVLVNNQVVANEPSLPTCIPITKNGIAYSCGEAKKKLASDTFYEVCSNNIAPPVPNSCASAGHILNPATGYCEVPPTPQCLDGYEVVEGGNQFSIDDDICQSKQFVVDKQCPSGYSLNGEKCQQVNVRNPQLQCPTGFTLSNGVCTSTTYTSSCQFSKKNGYGYGTDTHVFNNSKYIWYNQNVTGNPLYYRGSKVSGGCGSGGCVTYHQICKKTPVTNTTSPTKICPSDYKLEGNQCHKVIETAYIPTCPSGFQLSANRQYCTKIPEQLPVTLSCPSHYPNWNDEESRCTSKSLSPLASKPFEFNSNTEQLNATQSQQIVAMALAPFEHIINTIIPEAHAESELLSEGDKVTQESMNNYIAGKYLDMAETYQQDLSLYQAGQQKLMGVASSRSVEPSSYSSTAPSASVPSDSNKNVMCELFKGEAMECKVAVGGMQDCCKAPVKPSLADYISMTTKMIQMDALTGQVWGMESYTGVWDIASTWTSATADSAWSAIQGEFISPADVVAQGGDGAVSTAMSGVAQSMMQYTNQFLLDAFGPEVASMFFQDAGLAAGQAATGELVASNAMANVGAALTVIYYAYLAYVVFNLLVGIVFACEDEEMDLAMKKELLSTHYIGSYCATKVLGACIEKRRSYCVFDSPLSRIMMEQIYKQPQMNLSWGTAKKPNCKGVEIGKIENVNWDTVNLDEWVGILIQTNNYTDIANIDLDSLTGSGSNLNYKENGVDRLNTLEANEVRMDNVDIDEVRRDAYEDAWNKSQ